MTNLGPTWVHTLVGIPIPLYDGSANTAQAVPSGLRAALWVARCSLSVRPVVLSVCVLCQFYFGNHFLFFKSFSRYFCFTFHASRRPSLRPRKYRGQERPRKYGFMKRGYSKILTFHKMLRDPALLRPSSFCSPLFILVATVYYRF